MEVLHEILRAVLKHYPYIRLCILFGSTASGRSTSRSDLDVAIAAEEPLLPETRLELLEAFAAATNREIDLIDLMAETGPILKQALSKCVVVQNVDKLLYARLISRMLFAEADMMPYHNRILRERRTRFIDGQGRY
jgi:predicted nucleotidyltransferase